VIDAVFGADALWLLTSGGLLLSSCDEGATWEGPHSKRAVALAKDAGDRVAGLYRLDDGHLGRFVAADGAVTLLEGQGLDTAEVRAFAALASGSVVLTRGGQLYEVAKDGWKRVDGVSGVTAMTAADSGARLVAIYVEHEDGAWLARVGGDGAARVVAEIGDDGGEDEPRVLALAWDAERKLVWAGGAFGLIAFKPPGMRSSGGALAKERK
jgi:hypothetical protein